MPAGGCLCCGGWVCGWAWGLGVQCSSLISWWGGMGDARRVDHEERAERREDHPPTHAPHSPTSTLPALLRTLPSTLAEPECASVREGRGRVEGMGSRRKKQIDHTEARRRMSFFPTHQTPTTPTPPTHTHRDPLPCSSWRVPWPRWPQAALTAACGPVLPLCAPSPSLIHQPTHHHTQRGTPRSAQGLSLAACSARPCPGAVPVWPCALRREERRRALPSTCIHP